MIDRSPASSNRGYIYIACATLLWGISATLGRAAFTGRLLPAGQVFRPIDALILSQTRTTFSCIVLFIILIAHRGFKPLILTPVQIGRLALLGVLGVAASNYFYYLAIQRTNIATAIVVQYTAPIWVLLYALLRREQKPTWQRIGAVFLAVGGIAMVIRIFDGANFAPDRIGVAAALVAAFSFAFYNVAGHNILTRLDRWVVLLYTTLTASLFWIVINPPGKIVAAHFSPGQWLFLFIFSLTSVLGPFSFYFAGLQHLEPTRAIVVSCLEPVFSILIAAAVLGEIMRPLQTVGILLVLAAIVVVQLPGRQSPERQLEPID